MKKNILLLAISLLIIACKSETKTESLPKEIKNEQKQEMLYASFGTTISDENVLSNSEMLDTYTRLKVGDTALVKFTATVNEVCQAKGCWMRLDLGEKESMVRFKDYGFFMPTNIEEKEVIVHGKAFVSEMSVEEQRHYAEDAEKSAEEIAAITAVKVTYSFEADGVLLKK